MKLLIMPILYFLEIAIIICCIKYSYKLFDFKGIGLLRIMLILLYLLFTFAALISRNIYINITQGSLFALCCYGLISKTHPANYEMQFNKSKLKYFSQRDMRWGNIKYGSSDIAKCGCVPTVMAMAMSARDNEITPRSIIDWLKENGEVYILRDGTSVDCIEHFAEYNNIEYICLHPDKEKTLGKYLEEGYVFFILLPGKYMLGAAIANLSRTRHSILIIGMDEENYFIADPDLYWGGIHKIKKSNVAKFFEKSKNSRYIGLKVYEK